MMAMTPQGTKQFADIESAFLEPCFTPKNLLSSCKPRSTKTPTRGGWFSGLADKVVMKFVCCAPPQSLLDDDEINEILNAVDESNKYKPVLSHSHSRKDLLMRRNSASVMPLAATTGREEEPAVAAQLSDITHVLDTTSSVAAAQEPLATPPRPRFKFSTLQRAIVCLCSLQKSAERRRTERVVRAMQSQWRRRQAPAVVPYLPATTTVTTTINAEPEIEIEPATTAKKLTAHSPVITSPKRSRRRICKVNGRNKTHAKLDLVGSAAQEIQQAVTSLTELAATRKRLRSVNVESLIDSVDVERDVHLLFGAEEIDEEDDDDLASELLLLPPAAASAAAASSSGNLTIVRCVSAVPPRTAVRPVAIKSTVLIHAHAVSRVQRAWRHYKATQERETQRRLQQYETQKQSVMPTIRSKMNELRKRLEELQERSSLVVAVAPVDDDFDWL